MKRSRFRSFLGMSALLGLGSHDPFSLTFPAPTLQPDLRNPLPESKRREIEEATSRAAQAKRKRREARRAADIARTLKQQGKLA